MLLTEPVTWPTSLTLLRKHRKQDASPKKGLWKAKQKEKDTVSIEYYLQE